MLKSEVPDGSRLEIERRTPPEFLLSVSVDRVSKTERQVFYEKTSTGSIPILELVENEETAYSLAAARHGHAYDKCVAAVKSALADPKQNTNHVYRSPQWISNRCEKVEANHSGKAGEKREVEHKRKQGEYEQREKREDDNARASQRKQEARKREDIERANQRKQEEARKHEDNARANQRKQEEARKREDYARQNARANGRGYSGDSYTQRRDGSKMYCPPAGHGPCYTTPR